MNCATLANPVAKAIKARAAVAVDHVPALDGLRALAVLSVMAVHTGVPGFALGWLGVDLFFVLSGFLITMLLLQEYEQRRQISLRRFWARRFLRLMPAYWLYVGSITLLVLPVAWGWLRPHGSWTPAWYVASLWGYFVNYAPMGGIWEHQWLSGHLWSLAVEEQFYFVWPAACLFGLRRGWLLPITMMAVAAVLAVRVTTAVAIDSRLYTRGLAILLGCLAAIAVQQRPPVRQWVGRGGWLYVSAAMGFALLATVLHVRCGVPEVRIHRLFVPFLDTAFCLLVAHLWVQRQTLLARCLAARPLVAIGVISYGVYLYHMAVQFIVWKYLLAGIAHWNRWPKFACRAILFYSLTLAVAWLSYRFVERRFLSLKDRFRPAPTPERTDIAHA